MSSINTKSSPPNVKAAAACEQPDCDAAFRALMALEMKRIYDTRPGHGERKTLTRRKRNSEPGTDPTKRGAGEDAKRRAAEQREAFLGELERRGK